MEHVSDRTFLLHLGGKIEMALKAPIATRDDLSMAYTPGVARVSQAIADDPEKAWSLTIKRNTVAIVSDGTAVLGLGDIGPEAALPVMEGKAMLLKEFAGVDGWPVCLATTDTDEIVAVVTAIAPVYGAINLEDISAPRCFEIEERLRATLDIPVFHDDQHGTAIVVYAALVNALRVVGKRPQDVKVVITGVGAAGVAVTRILRHAGVGTIVGCDRQGAVYAGRPGLEGVKAEYAEETNPDGERGSRGRRARGRGRVHRVVAARSGLASTAIRTMAKDAIVFAMANPTPEVAPEELAGLAAVDRDRPVGLPEPDQQRARVPGRLSRRARRARARHHRGNEARGGRRDRRRDRRRRARAGVHRPERLQPRGRSRRRRRRRRSGRARRRRAPLPRGRGRLERGSVPLPAPAAPGGFRARPGRSAARSRRARSGRTPRRPGRTRRPG